MKEQRHILHQFYVTLREAGFSLGTAEYKAVLKAVQNGYGWESRAALRRVCKRIWLGQESEESEFDFYFDLVMSIAEAEQKTMVPQEEPAPSLEEPPELPPEVKEQIHDDVQDSHQQFSQEVEDPISARSAIAKGLGKSDKHKAPVQKRLLPGLDYLPLRRRELQRRWSMLRRMEKQAVSGEIDLGATIADICRNGFFIEPVWQRSRQNTSRLILLIDHGGSMAAFEELGIRLAETAQKTGYLSQVEVYYFYNHPGDTLFLDRMHTRAVDSGEVFRKADPHRSFLLIFGDAGAARGSFNRQRIGDTRRFLRYRVAPYMRHAAWLNPMPARRWSETTAEQIGSYIPMYEVDRAGIEKAFSALRSLKPTIT